MTLTLDRPPSRPHTAAPLAVIDCDIHNTLASDAVLGEFLPERWRKHLADHGIRFYYPGAFYPRLNPNAARTDATRSTWRASRPTRTTARPWPPD
jgi:hypothetical protein